jgi:hypothetical protein
MAEERRKNELRRKVNKLHHSRNVYETLQSKNYDQYTENHDRVLKKICLFFCNRRMADAQRRRYELLNEMKQKDRRSKHFVEEKEGAANLVRTAIFLKFYFNQYFLLLTVSIIG